LQQHDLENKTLNNPSRLQHIHAANSIKLIYKKQLQNV